MSGQLRLSTYGKKEQFGSRYHKNRDVCSFRSRI